MHRLIKLSENSSNLIIGEAFCTQEQSPQWTYCCTKYQGNSGAFQSKSFVFLKCHNTETEYKCSIQFPYFWCYGILPFKQIQNDVVAGFGIVEKGLVNYSATVLVQIY